MNQHHYDDEDDLADGDYDTIDKNVVIFFTRTSSDIQSYDQEMLKELSDQLVDTKTRVNWNQFIA